LLGLLVSALNTGTNISNTPTSARTC
jgi:hypothetical protein